MAKVYQLNVRKGRVFFYFLSIILCIAFFAPIVTYFLHRIFNLLGPLDYMPLSLSGVENWFLWQPFTYFFIISTSLEITLESLLVLAFHLFLLWITGKEIISTFGYNHFFIIYFGSGLLGAALVLLFQWLTGSSIPLATLFPPLFGILTVWLLLYSDLVFSFLFFVRLKVKWLVIALFALSLLINLATQRYNIFFAHLAGIIFGLLYGWGILKMSPKEIYTVKNRRKKKASPRSNHFQSEKIISIDDDDSKRF